LKHLVFKKVFYVSIMASIIGSVFVSQTGRADDETVTWVKQKLNAQMSLLKGMEDIVERPDLGSVRFLEEVNQAVLGSLEHEEIFNPSTYQKFDRWVFDYKYSKPLLDKLTLTPSVHESVEQVRSIYNEIVEKFHYNSIESPLTRVAETFNMVNKYFDQLMQLPISDELKDKLRDLKPALANVIAIGRQGDNVPTFDAATPVYGKVVELYPYFDQISQSDEAFEIVSQIQGLMQVYGNFAAVNRGTKYNSEIVPQATPPAVK